MKIIRIVESAPSGAALDFHPDSALLLAGRPLFLPDFAAQPMADIHIGIRINRLGKAVAQKFAHRYYDALAPVMRLTYPDLPASMQGLLTGMDSSLAIGSWLPVADWTALSALDINGSPAPLHHDAAAIDAVVAEVSRYVTLKMGDVILLPPVASGLLLTPSTHLTVGPDLLDVKIL